MGNALHLAGTKLIPFFVAHLLHSLTTLLITRISRGTTTPRSSAKPSVLIEMSFDNLTPVMVLV